MRVYICACEELYYGLHGINDWRVVEVSSIEEANDYGREMSQEVIESFDVTSEYAYGDGDGEVFDSDYLVWHVWEINEEVAKGMSIKELEAEVNCFEDEDFITKYCKEIKE